MSKQASTAAKSSSWSGVIKRVFLYAILFVALWWIVGCMIQRKLLFPRGYAQMPAQTVKPAALREVWIDTPQGKVEAWFLPGHGVSPERPGPAVLFAHGNAELIDNNVGIMKGYQMSGVSVLACEFRGYGRSAGDPSQEAITADFVQFYDLLAVMPEVDKAKIIFHGRSLGGGAVCALAEQRKPAAIVLQSTFRSVKAMAARYLLPAFCVRDPFDNEATLAKYNGPVLLFHGTKDSVIPHSHGVALSKIAKRVTFIEYDCDHNDFPPKDDVFWEDVEKFLRGAGMIQ